MRMRIRNATSHCEPIKSGHRQRAGNHPLEDSPGWFSSICFFIAGGLISQPHIIIPMQSHLAHTKKGECGHFWLTNGIVRALIESSYVDALSIFITSQLLITAQAVRLRIQIRSSHAGVVV